VPRHERLVGPWLEHQVADADARTLSAVEVLEISVETPRGDDGSR
jgi:hypothetical protein